jgi:hypothetical protein
VSPPVGREEPKPLKVEKPKQKGRGIPARAVVAAPKKPAEEINDAAAAQLEKLVSLKDQGILTEHEFQSAVARLMASA